MKKTIKKLLSLFIICGTLLLASCTDTNRTEKWLTINDIKNNIRMEGLSISRIQLPENLSSSKVANQEGYEINGTKDLLYIYEFEDKKAMQAAIRDLQNNVRKLEPNNNIKQITGKNIFVVYVKHDENEFETENKISGIVR